MVWANQDLVLYHGTTSLEVSFRKSGTGKLELYTAQHGIKLNAGNQFAEFGLGFYTTTIIQQAKDWANIRAKLKCIHYSSDEVSAVVLRYIINRDILSELKHVAFVKDTNDYWDLVRNCRTGKPQRPHPQGPYDVVYGPVSRRGRRNILPNADQVSFHTEDALAIIPPPTLAAFGNPIIP